MVSLVPLGPTDCRPAVLSGTTHRTGTLSGLLPNGAVQEIPIIKAVATGPAAVRRCRPGVPCRGSELSGRFHNYGSAVSVRLGVGLRDRLEIELPRQPGQLFGSPVSHQLEG